MNIFNSVTSAIFDVVLGWFGNASAWIDTILWAVLAGIVALFVYKVVSNQKGIEKAKNDIKVHLLEIRLFQDDIAGVIVSTGKILAKNALYIGHNVVPMIVMIVPMMAIAIQLVANYALDPVDPGTVQVLEVKLDLEQTDASTREVALDLPAGIALEAPPVRTKDAVFWRIRADEAGDHTLSIRVGDEVVEKGLAVGGDHRKVPVMRTKSWDMLLYPGEDGLPGGSPVYEVRLGTPYPTRDLGWLPGGEMGILMSFLVLSLAAGFALKAVFGVTL